MNRSLLKPRSSTRKTIRTGRTASAEAGVDRQAAQEVSGFVFDDEHIEKPAYFVRGLYSHHRSFKVASATTHSKIARIHNRTTT